jgi:hypothetical protein
VSNIENHVELPFMDVPEILPVPVTQPQGPSREPIPIINNDPSYRNIAKVEEIGIKPAGIVNEVLNTPITMTIGDILSLNKPARDELRKRLTRKKIPVIQKALAFIESLSRTELEYWQNFAQENDIRQIIRGENIPQSSDVCTTITSSENNVKPGTVVITDPIVQFLETLPTDQRPPVIVSARDSEHLRAVWPIINNVGPEECLLDGGSQIVSMSREAAEKLDLNWDPDLCIHMQSANKQIEKTLGIARNVPFKFGEITLYLQVHILNTAAYNVLLGRPFDTLTRSGYQNEDDGSMTMTIKCPNTKKRGTFVTHSRGEIPRSIIKETPKDFG